MSLSEAMYRRLLQSASEAEQERSKLPQGLIPMSHEQGGEVLRHIRTHHHEERPRLPLRTMTMDDGARAQQMLTFRHVPLVHHGPPSEPSLIPPGQSESIKSFLRRFLR
jgi:hypothetical protein